MRRIEVYGSDLRFAAAHFTTFGGQCEALHGHNYAVAVRVEGELAAESWVMDFLELRGLVGGLCQELDHAFVLPTQNAHLEIERVAGEYRIGFGERRYVMPEADVRPLPIDNSTAERLAEWLAGRLGEQLRSRGAASLSSLTVTLEEAPGQSASFTLLLDTTPQENKEHRTRNQ